MSKKRKHAIWVEPNGRKVNPRIADQLASVVLDHAILDDVTCPSVGSVPRDEYVNDLASRLRDHVCEILQQANLPAGEEELQALCRGTAGEVLVIRGLRELLLDDEISLNDLQHLPFFKTYRDYFAQTPEMVKRAFQMALSVAAAHGPQGQKEDEER
jgi:hypothetical protein